MRRGDEVWLYVHEEVPGITFDRAVPLLLQPFLLRAEKSARVVRYSFSCQILATWTETALGALMPPTGGGGAVRVSCGTEAGATARLDSTCDWKARGAGLLLASGHKRAPQPLP